MHFFYSPPDLCHGRLHESLLQSKVQQCLTFDLQRRPGLHPFFRQCNQNDWETLFFLFYLNLTIDSCSMPLLTPRQTTCCLFERLPTATVSVTHSHSVVTRQEMTLWYWRWRTQKNLHVNVDALKKTNIDLYIWRVCWWQLILELNGMHFYRLVSLIFFPPEVSDTVREEL